MTTECIRAIMTHAGRNASRLVATSCFSRDEWDDVCQELALDCLRRSRKFDANRGTWDGFVSGVTRNQASVLANRRLVHRRRELLVEDVVTLPEQSEWQKLEYLHVGTEHDYDRRIHTQRTMEGLPVQLQQLARMLGEYSTAEICAELGKSRSRIHQLTHDLRRVFVSAGITPDAYRCGRHCV